MSTSVALSSTLGSPSHYCPSLKVEHRLFDKLWASAQETSKLGIDCWTLCAQLDLLCKRELLQYKNQKVENGNTTIDFESKAELYMNRLQSVYQDVPSLRLSLVQYLEQRGISKLYPRAYVYIKNPGAFNMELQSTHMELYNHQMSVINQVLCLSKQIHSDLRTGTSHKYIAHQLAVLYQCLKPLSEVPMLSAIKSNIEENFSSVKESLCMCPEGSDVPRLPQQYSKWLLQIVEEISKTLTEYPEQITSALQGPAKVASRIM